MVSCSIHLIDNGLKGFLRSATPDAEAVPGLLSSQRLTGAEFNGKQAPAPLHLSRNGFFAFWDNDAAIDRFLGSSDAGPWTDGWHVRTTPTRAVGRWSGLPTDIDRSVHTESDGPVIGISIGPLRLSRAVKFNKLNAAVEAQLFESDGVLWHSAFFAPPSTTCSLTFWKSAHHLHGFARSGAHVEAMKASLDPGYDPSLPEGTNFFKPDLLFASLNPYRVEGSLAGKNPLPESVFGTLATL